MDFNQEKTPEGELDFEVDWSDWLEAAEIIVTSTWQAAGVAMLGGSKAPTFTNTTAKVWVNGGTLHETHTVTNLITTDQGRIDSRDLAIRIVRKLK